MATSKDIPGLVLESDSFDKMIMKVHNAVPELKMQSISATDVRKKWSTVCDDAARNRPVFFRRTHDDMLNTCDIIPIEKELPVNGQLARNNL